MIGSFIIGIALACDVWAGAHYGLFDAHNGDPAQLSFVAIGVVLILLAIEKLGEF